MSTILISGATLVDPDLELRTADVLVEDDRIAQIAPTIRSAADRTIAAHGKYLMPGLVNAHSHSGHTLYRGFVDDLPLDRWMAYVVHAAGQPTPRELYVSAAIGALEMLKSGTTAVLDHGPPMSIDTFAEGVDAVMRAYIDTGMRASVAPSFTDVDYYQTLPLELLQPNGDVPMSPRRAAPLNALLDELQRFVQRWQHRHPLLSCLVGPSAPQRCTRELLEACVALARAVGVGLHTHLLETKSQRLAMSRLYGRSVVAYLDELGFLGSTTSVAHGVWLDDREIDLLAARDTVLVHNPISNLKLGSGVAPLQTMLRKGLTVALGGDGAAANDSQNMFEVLKATSLLHRLKDPSSEWPTAEKVFGLCVNNGARALGRDVGSLKTGFLADLVLLDGSRLFATPKAQLIGQLVYADLGRSVETVLVGGEVVVEHGHATKVNEDALFTEAREYVARMYGDLGRRRSVADRADPLLRKLEAAVSDTSVPLRRRLGP